MLCVGCYCGDGLLWQSLACEFFRQLSCSLFELLGALGRRKTFAFSVRDSFIDSQRTLLLSADSF